MASSSKLAALFLMAILLCLICTRSQAARPEPGSRDHKSQEEPEAIECHGGEAEEECLMRRTLVAHTDYIYTQGKHN
uniref:Phytosulfokine n=1 Tax=Leersia perrieri TaxID=77586 RepID=A0A0D9VRK7_9ORYZ